MNIYILRDSTVKAHLGAYLQRLMDAGKTPEVKVNEDYDPSRSNDQNSLMWKILDAFSKQKPWPVNGESVLMDAESWKDVLTAAFDADTQPRVARGYNGGVVMLGRRTSKWGKAKFSEFIDWLQAAAVEMNVEWGE